MAEVPVEQQQHDVVDEERLKYLEFVHVAAIHAVLCFYKLYDLAKENSGPLKPKVQSAEGTVKAVVGPVYDKLRDVPYELLKFVDRKVGDSLGECENHVPAVVKKVSTQARAVTQKAPAVARSVGSEVQRVAGEVQRGGVVQTATGLAKMAVTKCEPTAKELYAKYEPVAEHYAVSGWRTLNKLPFFPQVSEVVVPTAAQLSEKYNCMVYSGREKGYTVAQYLLPVPTQKIAEVFGEQNAAVATQ